MECRSYAESYPVKRIYWNFVNWLRRIRTLLAYSKLVIVYKLHLVRTNRIRVGGYDIRFGDLRQLVNLYKEIFVQRAYLCALGDSPIIVDAGANIGLAVLFFKERYPDARVVAFEPNPSAFKCLKENVEVNGLEGVQLINAALGGTKGVITFYLSTDMASADVGASAIKEHVAHLHGHKGAINEIAVQCQTLSSFVAADIDLLKLDIEGAECEVILELGQRLSKVKNVIMEYHYNFADASNSLSNILCALEDNRHMYRILPEEDSTELEQCLNYVIRSKRCSP